MLENLIIGYSNYFSNCGQSEKRNLVNLLTKNILTYYSDFEEDIYLGQDLLELLEKNRDFSSTHILVLLIIDNLKNYEKN
jgi:hypothetical protein